MRFKENLH